MATNSDHDLKVISPKGVPSKRQDGNLRQKSPHRRNSTGKEHVSRQRESNSSASVSFSTNHNSVVCLPLVSEGLKLVWTQSDQTRELDTIPELVQAFNVFPYPTSQEVSTLARICALPLDKIKVWFMVQRIKYGISWASEDIEETRLKLARPVHISEMEQKESKTKRKNGFDDLMEAERKHEDNVEGLGHTHLPHKRHKNESKEPAKLSPAASRFRSSLPPPQDSYYYRHPVEMAEMPQAATSPTSTESPVGSEQPRHSRYKKSKAQLAALRKSFLQENWPDETELQRLQEETGLTRNDIRKWFSDSRYQLRNGRGLSASTPMPATEGEKNESMSNLLSQTEEIQPLSLTTKKLKTMQNTDGQGRKNARAKGARKNQSKDTEFFQNFLSNTLEAFEDGASGLDEEKCLGEIQINDDVGSELDSEGHCAPVAPTSSSPCITPSKKHSAKPQSLKSARSVKTNTLANSPHLSDHSSPSVLTAAGRQRKTKEQLAILKEYFQRCPWPKSEVYTELVEVTSLPRADIIQWFGDTRYAVKNGHVRWVHANARDQVLAEIVLQSDGSGSSGTPGSEGSKKRKSQGNSIPKTQKSATDSTDIGPLELYYRQTGLLQEKDLDSLCRKSKMSYQQVRDWFAAKDSNTLDIELNVID
ncbi:zinc fingers and homeoboxes protein 1-like [Myxocyprinus asiaticus]|uniref:zinc fingers and homeoboxes protein 1-like n=1 Tax=Myxocyprinus asiaticus TaxID=70543 RepID=UPI0022226B77|nr:zinc fingers and homeoboxes protein 1-like [Myxocyprinus asiaticus]XP_051553310.1 zinc fingers and homeoboxes protein 1-like [Myxocyprinus asiaticus]XP_051553311.1 zinc fingers and homeoboxes protein 1-like [Myxocyprinus asiaticus]